MNKLIPIFFLLLSCSSSKTKNDDAIQKDSIPSNTNSFVDSDKIKLENRRRELEKIGYNYSNKIVSREKITFDGKELTYIQDLLDSSDQVKGKLYVELLNDSSFARLYILDGKELKYFIGDNIITNKLDTTTYSNDRNLPFQFELRWKHEFTVFFAGSDPLTINHYDKKRKFDWFRTP